MRAEAVLGVALAALLFGYFAGRPRCGGDSRPDAAAPDQGTAPFARTPPAPAARIDGGASPADAAASGSLITGEVVDEAGRAIVGASVVALGGGGDAAAPDGGPGGAWARLQPAGELGVLRGPLPYPSALSAGAVVASGRTARGVAASTDGSGRFRLVALPPGLVSIVASHPSYAEARSTPLRLDGRSPVQVHLVLQRGQALRGRVVDDRRFGVAGAELWARGELLAISDGNGGFALRPLTTQVEIEVRARGHLTARRLINPADPAVDRELEISLEPAGGQLGGVVVDERAFPVAGARLVVEAGVVRREVTSDGRGAFRLEGLPVAPLKLRVSHDEHPPQTVEGAQPGDDLRIVLLPGAGVEGDLRDARTAAVPAGARVTVESDGSSRQGAPDRRGHFRLLGCAPGGATIRATAPGYLPLALTVELPPAEWSREVTLRDLRLELHLGGTVAGVVRDERGAPRAGIEVSAGELRVKSDSSGRFRLTPLPSGRVEVAAGAAHASVFVEPGREVAAELRLR